MRHVWMFPLGLASALRCWPELRFELLAPIWRGQRAREVGRTRRSCHTDHDLAAAVP
jgi:hypothetical protein